MTVKFLENKSIFWKYFVFYPVLHACSTALYSKYFPPENNFKFIIVEALKIGSVILTLSHTCGISKKKPGEWTHFSKILWRAPLCLPGLLPGGWFPCIILSIFSRSNVTCWRVRSFCVFQMLPPWEPVWSRRHALAPYPLLPGPAEWKLGSLLLRLRGWTGGTAVPPPGASDFYLPDFTVC